MHVKHLWAPHSCTVLPSLHAAAVQEKNGAQLRQHQRRAEARTARHHLTAAVHAMPTIAPDRPLSASKPLRASWDEPMPSASRTASCAAASRPVTIPCTAHRAGAAPPPRLRDPALGIFRPALQSLGPRKRAPRRQGGGAGAVDPLRRSLLQPSRHGGLQGSGGGAAHGMVELAQIHTELLRVQGLLERETGASAAGQCHRCRRK